VKSRADQISADAIPSILQYMAAYLDSPHDPERVNAFVCDLFGPRKYIKVIRLLAARGLTNADWPAMLRALAATGNEQIYSCVKPSIPAIAEAVKANPHSLLPLVIRCLFLVSDKQTISEFAIAVLNQVKNSAAPIRLLFPWLAQLKTHPCYQAPQSPMIQVYAAIWALFQNEQFRAEIDPAPFGVLAGVVAAQSTFQAVDPGTDWRSSEGRGDRDARAVVDGQKSLAALLDEQESIKVEQPPERMARTPSRGLEIGASRSAPSIRSAERPRGVTQRDSPTPVRLSEMAAKKGGKLSREWRKTQFEFSVVNRCLIWRSEHKKDVVKGVLLLDQSVKVERADRVLTIKTSAKTHQIQFEKGGTAEIWLNAMRHAIDSKE